MSCVCSACSRDSKREKPSNITEHSATMRTVHTWSIVRLEGADRPAACAGTDNALQELERAMRDVFGPFFFAEDTVRSGPNLDMLCKYGVPQIIGCGIARHCSFLTGWSPSSLDITETWILKCRSWRCWMWPERSSTLLLLPFPLISSSGVISNILFAASDPNRSFYFTKSLELNFSHSLHIHLAIHGGRLLAANTFAVFAMITSWGLHEASQFWEFCNFFAYECSVVFLK